MSSRQLTDISYSRGAIMASMVYSSPPKHPTTTSIVFLPVQIPLPRAACDLSYIRWGRPSVSTTGGVINANWPVGQVRPPRPECQRRPSPGCPLPITPSRRFEFVYQGGRLSRLRSEGLRRRCPMGNRHRSSSLSRWAYVPSRRLPTLTDR